MINLSTFLALPPEEVASLVRQAGPQVCVFPINGTRRWYSLEVQDERSNYVSVSAKQYVRLFRLLFDHGIDTILSPLFGKELLNRGDEYTQEALGGAAAILRGDEFVSFFNAYGVRVRFYGDFRTVLSGMSFGPELINVIDQLTASTESHTQYCLFFGLFAEDATEAVSRLAVEHFQKTGKVATRNEIVSAYYGENVAPATLFIGFEKPAVFDYPLLNLGEESLYFTSAPTPYMAQWTLRQILYDHLYTRRAADPDWFNQQDLSSIRRAYRSKLMGQVLGVGERVLGIWLQQGIIIEEGSQHDTAG